MKARKIESLRVAEDEETGLALPVLPAARPIATPARSMDDVLVRPASTDAQPRSQQLWDSAFPDGSEDADGLNEATTTRAVEPETSHVSAESQEPETRKPMETQEPMETEHPAAVAEASDASDDDLIMDVDCATSLHSCCLRNVHATQII